MTEAAASGGEPQAKMWSGRFREPLDHAFEQWQRSFPFDWRLLPQEIAASKAHAHAIAHAGVLTEAELASLLVGLDQVLATTVEAARSRFAAVLPQATRMEFVDLGPAIVASAPEAEDIHHYVELTLHRLIGDLALKLHTGRSRNEQIATDLRLYVRLAIDVATAELRVWLGALLDRAEAAGDAVMPAYTHLQRAEPVLVAHWLLAYVSMLERDLSRLVDCRRRLNHCPLGSGAVAGATLALDRTIAARMLGFDRPTANSIDATSDRDFAVEFAQAAAVLGLHLSRFAEEIILFSTSEYGFIDLPERFSTGSSAMPQKKNPDLAELLRGKSARILGVATTLSTLLKGLPLAYNKDLQETQEPLFDLVETVLSTLPLLGPFTQALVLRDDVLLHASTHGYLNAMSAATYLVHRGLPFRRAHEQIGRAVRLAVDRGVELDQLSLEELRGIGDHFDEGFLEALSLQATLESHDVTGGTAPERVKAAMIEARDRLVQLGHTLDQLPHTEVSIAG